MTNIEAISASLYPYDADEALKEKACIDEGLDARGEYSGELKASAARAAIAILRHLLVLDSETTGGCSLSYDTDKLRVRIFDLARENGLSDIADEAECRAKITDISPTW